MGYRICLTSNIYKAAPKVIARIVAPSAIFCLLLTGFPVYGGRGGA